MLELLELEEVVPLLLDSVSVSLVGLPAPLEAAVAIAWSARPRAALGGSEAFSLGVGSCPAPCLAVLISLGPAFLDVRTSCRAYTTRYTSWYCILGASSGEAPFARCLWESSRHSQPSSVRITVL